MENNITISGNSKEIIKEVLFRETSEFSAAGRVIGVSADSKVTGFETLENELRVSIKTTFCAVVCDENGTYERETTECESIRAIEVKGILPQSKVCPVTKVTDCEITGRNPCRVRATVGIGGWFVREEEITFLSAGEGLHCKTESISVESVVPLANNTLTLTFTDEARMPIAKMIDYSAAVTVSGVYPSTGTYRVEGDISFRIVAITDNGQFITQNFSHPFSAENADERIQADMRPDIEGIIKAISFATAESDKRVIVCDAEVILCGVALQKQEVDRVIDAYSVTNDIALSTETRKVNNHFCIRSVREKATGMISPGGIGEVLGVMSPCVAASTAVSGGNVNTEGVISFTVLYTDENNSPEGVQGEIPFLSSIGGEYLCESVLAPEVVVTSLGARQRGGELEVTAELLVTVRGVQSEEIAVVSDAVIGAKKEDDGFAISLYIVREGETLWDVAKALGTDEDTLVEQNTEISLPLKGGEKVILYKPL